VAPVAASLPANGAAQEQEPAGRPVSTGQLLAKIVHQRHGQYLTEAQMRQITQRIDNNLRAADRMKRIPVQNGEEPAFEFHADIP
jgi:hypothetical protein